MHSPAVCWFLSPFDGRAGAGQRAAHLAEAIAQTGLAVRFIRPPADSALPPLADAVQALRAEWLKNRPWCVHVEVPGYAGEPWRMVANELGIPLLCTWHPVFWMTAPEQQASLKVALRTFVGACQQVLVETPAVRIQLAAEGVLNTTLVANGVNRERFSPTKRSSQRRLTWGANDDTPVVLYAGRLQPEKNLGLLAATCNAIVAAHPHARCVIAGDGTAAADLARACPHLRLLGHLTGDDLAEVYASADIFLFPSLEDMYGNVALEAAASGLAVVAFDRAAAGDHLRRSAALIPMHDAEGFMAAGVALAGAPNERRRLGAAARDATATLTWAATARHFLTAVERAQRTPPPLPIPGLVPVVASVHAFLPTDPSSEPFATIRLLTVRGHHITWHHDTTTTSLTVGEQSRPLAELVNGLPPGDERGPWSRRIETAEGRLCAWAANQTPTDTPLRIAACLAAPFVHAGAAVRFTNLVAGLRQLGHAVQIQAETASSQSLKPLADANERQRRLARLVAGLCHTWKFDRPDVVYIEVLDSFGACAAEAAQTCRIPWVGTWHALGSFIAEADRTAVENSLSGIACQASALVAETPDQAADLARLGLPCAGLVGNGVDMQRFTPSKRSEKLRATWACDMAVLAVGRLHAAKNVAALIDLHHALVTIPGARLIIVGDGPERDTLHHAMPHALFLGEQHGDALAAIYASADLFVFPSRIDSFGIVVAEALASGLPVIGYDRAAVAELVTDGINGKRVPLGNDLVHVVADFCQQFPNPAMITAARAAAEKCSWRRSAVLLETELTRVTQTFLTRTNTTC